MTSSYHVFARTFICISSFKLFQCFFVSSTISVGFNGGLFLSHQEGSYEKKKKYCIYPVRGNKLGAVNERTQDQTLHLQKKNQNAQKERALFWKLGVSLFSNLRHLGLTKSCRYASPMAYCSPTRGLCGSWEWRAFLSLDHLCINRYQN